jgi:hypothetical protein
LTDPTTAATSPEPGDVPSSGVSLIGAPVRVDLTGAKNGANASFVIPVTLITGSVVLVMWNGLPLYEGVGYTRSGSTITVTTPPSSGDTLEALVWA